MRYLPTKVSLENDEPVDQEAGIEFREAENPFLDTIAANNPIENTPEQIEVVIVEDKAEVVEAAVVVDDVSVAIESLEAIAQHLAQLKTKGESVSVESAALLNISVVNAVRKFPAFKQTTVVDSFENFAFNPVDATNVSLENIGDKIKSGYEALVKFIKDLWLRFKAFIGSVLSGAAVAESAARKNMDDLKTVNSTRRPEGEITIPAILNNPVLTKAAIDNLIKIIDSIGMVSYQDLVAEVEKIREQKSFTVEQVSDVTAKVFDAYGRMSEDAYLGNLSFNNDQFPPSIKLLDSESRQAKPLVISQIKEFTNANLKLCASITELKKSLPERSKALAAVAANVELVARRAHKTGDDPNISDDESMHSHAEISTSIRTQVQLLSKLQAFETKVLGRAVQVANSINKVCADSIKAYG